MAEEMVELLKYGKNVGIVHYHGRSFPGVLLQGDTVSTIWLELKSIRKEIRADVKEAELGLDELIGKFGAYLDLYESVLAERGIALPYGPR